MTEKFIQPEFILEKTLTRKDSRTNLYYVKNIDFNVKPMFVKAGIYTFRKCEVVDGQLRWVDETKKSAICLDIFNHYRNMIIMFQTLEPLVNQKTTPLNRLLEILKIKKPIMVPPDMPKQIMVQLVGVMNNQQKEGEQ